VIEDASNRSKLAKLLRFKSTASNSTDGRDGAWRSLEDYVAGLKEGQRQIYYLAGESVKELASSPFLERFAARGLEVLFLTDPIDEYTVQNMPEFDGHKLQSITKEGLVLPNEGKDEKRRAEAYAADFKGLTDAMKAALGDRVEKVVVSSRLASSPAVLVTSQYGNSANMERIMRAQAFADPSKAAMMKSSKTLEVNPRHPIIVKLSETIAAAPEDAAARDVTFLLYDNALVNSGFAFDDATAFQGRLSRTIAAALKLESLDLAPERELPPEPTPAPEPEGEDEDEDEAGEDEGAAPGDAPAAAGAEL